MDLYCQAFGPLFLPASLSQSLMPLLVHFLPFIALRLNVFKQKRQWEISSHYLPFVVEVPYSTAPRMVRYQGPLIDLSARAEYLEAKRAELATLGHALSGHIAHHDLAPLIQHAAHALKLANPDQIQSIEDLALCLEEDVALMQDGVLSAICFCFPSSWVPTERIGMPLGKIHEHVADGQKLVAASPKIAHVMSDLEQGSFRRYVWTITNSPRLSQHPSHKNANIPVTIDDLYYRVETQTTLPLPSTTGRSSLCS